MSSHLDNKPASVPSPERFTIVAPPSSTTPVPTPYSDAVLLHVLATHPDTVIPPGKSLRAALLRPDGETSPPGRNQGHPPSLHSAVGEIVHRAFWDEALESLSGTEPARQLARLRSLYKDLHTALEGLLPKSHPAYVALGDPLSPTSAPLLSARRHLSGLVDALQMRCAPIRDAQLSSIRSTLESEDPSDLPQRIIQAIRSLLEVADLMKHDLSSAILSTVGDEDLEREIIRIAREEERRTVLEIYGAKGTKDRWEAWLADEDSSAGNYTWVRQLVKALGADIAISVPLPTTHDSAVVENDNQANALPPPFLFSARDLFHIQNYIQALVIAAVLRTLAPLHSRPPPIQLDHISPVSSDVNPTTLPDIAEDTPGNRTFAERVLSLLMIEVDETSEDAGTTKIVNLADELAREHRRLQESPRSAPLPPIEETTLRSRVDALLRPTNGVFVLLRKRLLNTLEEEIIYALRRQARTQSQRVAPETMRTGLDRERERKRPRLDHLSPSSSTAKENEVGSLRRYLTEDSGRSGRAIGQAKGFEDPVLQRGIGEVLGELANVVDWVRDTWSDFDGLGSVSEGYGEKVAGDAGHGEEYRTGSEGLDE